MKLKYIAFFILFCFSMFSGAQEIENRKIENWYTDYVADENGNRLSGIQVQIQGSNLSVETNINGVFKIKASIGDIIVLSKNGVIINSYVYDGSHQYEIEDNSNISYKSVKCKKDNLFQIQLDSANYYKKNNPFKSISFIENALEGLNSSRGNYSKIAKAYNVLGDVYFNLKQYDLAISNYITSMRKAA